MAPTHRPTPTSLRMRIAELRILQHRVAAKLDLSDSHLSHLLTGRKPADEVTLARIARAIEDVGAGTLAPMTALEQRAQDGDR